MSAASMGNATGLPRGAEHNEEKAMRKNPRWLKSVMTASTDEASKLPFERDNRVPSDIRRLPVGKPQLRVAKG